MKEIDQIDTKSMIELAKKKPEKYNGFDEDKQNLIEAAHILREKGYSWVEIDIFLKENNAPLSFVTIRKGHKEIHEKEIELNNDTKTA